MRMPILCIIALMQTSAYAIEKMECLGTEPFWGASINDRELVLDFAGDTKTYPIPTFKAAAGTGPDYVTSIQARNRTQYSCRREPCTGSSAWPHSGKTCPSAWIEHREYLGSVEAPDRERAEAVAIKQFGLDYDQRRRLLIQERP